MTLRLRSTVLAMCVLLGGCGPDPYGVPTTAAPAPTARPTAEPSTSASPTPVAGEPPRLALEPVVAGLEDPLDIAFRAGDRERLFVAEQVGRIRVIASGTLLDRPFLDIAGMVSAGGEQGLLGLSFHPSSADGRFFVYYTALDGREIVASYRTLVDDPTRADPDSGRILLRMDDPFGNHNGGGLAFGPDGFLYVSTGDGGGAGDPLDSGRHLDTLLAKVLRLDVDVPADADPPYGIPADNPFLHTNGARPEIWLTGLRNPWRIRFDRATGDLWMGDVGQGAWEEIDVARAGVGGLDFGWNVMEGRHCYEAAGDDCATPELTLPVSEYGHDEGCSVTGGAVYRGTAEAALQGWYLFSDYCSGRFWAIAAAGDAFRSPTPVLDSDRSISAIAEDADGELYATDLAGGAVLHLVVDAGG